jgi:hypothetical protein
MKFKFPVVIIDEDFRSGNASGLGIRALAEAIEREGITETFPNSLSSKAGPRPLSSRSMMMSLHRKPPCIRL